MLCKKCKKPLTGKQTSYCSSFCSKTHLKSLYRQRHRGELNRYNRAYRAAMDLDRRAKMPEKDRCRRCGTTYKLTINHIVPRAAGGSDDPSNLEVLCGSCNTKEFHELVKKALVFYFKHQAA